MLKLIGMFDSPFVRPVAISAKLLGIPFEHVNWSVGKDFDRIRQYNPLGRSPTLVLDDGEALVESWAMLDYLDDRVGPDRALLPKSGAERRTALRLMSFAMGAAEKAREQIVERVFRPAEKRYEPWQERCRTQMRAALAELERYAAQKRDAQWLVGGRLTQADVTVSCIFTFLTEAVPAAFKPGDYPMLRAHVARCEAMPEFRTTRAPWTAPTTDVPSPQPSPASGRGRKTSGGKGSKAAARKKRAPKRSVRAKKSRAKRRAAPRRRSRAGGRRT